MHFNRIYYKARPLFLFTNDSNNTLTPDPGALRLEAAIGQSSLSPEEESCYQRHLKSRLESS